MNLLTLACRDVERTPGVASLEAVVDSVHGFSGFSFRDPEGNVWDVAWKVGSAVGDDGSLAWDP
ncbi:MAG: hypothetical protein HY263_06720 [Chloroflexi bacterium]|nr:hypothetical protein [Chloroflexota bacterium]